MEETISVANQCDTEEVPKKEVKLSSVTKGSRSYNSYRNLKKGEEHCDSLSSKLNEKEEKLTKLNANFNMHGTEKTQNENFKKENK